MARRNARERRRVHTVNQAFNRLKAFIPTLKQKTKRVSKLKILKAAIDYVYDLQDILADYESDLVDQGSGKNDGRCEIYDQSHSAQLQKGPVVEQKAPKGAHAQLAYQYSGNMAEAQVRRLVPKRD